jgi:hypothetical protein
MLEKTLVTKKQKIIIESTTQKDDPVEIISGLFGLVEV